MIPSCIYWVIARCYLVSSALYTLSFNTLYTFFFLLSHVTVISVIVFLYYIGYLYWKSSNLNLPTGTVYNNGRYLQPF